MVRIAANPVAVAAAATPQPPQTSPPWHLLKGGKISAPLALSGAERQRQEKRTPPEEIEADLYIMKKRLEVIQKRDGHHVPMTALVWSTAHPWGLCVDKRLGARWNLNHGDELIVSDDEHTELIVIMRNSLLASTCI